ncbi:MAG: glycosyltransferase [Sphingomonadaceae bacterium]|uniref:glycosyltransferase n=1 Tax=Thermaurantiacus sp. TaxID=2820283 RepID=UPI00298F3B82|nr:glycosyltransferase family 2 protein [Thermaurantiacus sp.]MCS6986097.1 glycosyltransferase [Sphingomonadaceae bacterium]MDW8414687.1 glycosyltransferase family 2 protein [Thermaurantiacus sp.]
MLLGPDSAERPRASVIVPHFNQPEHLVRCLQALAAQRIDWGGFEILVVDNGSRLSLGPLQATWPQVRFLVERERGPGPARNRGAAEARGEVLAFVDADVVVAPGWLQAGLDALARHPESPVGGDVRIRVRDPARMTGVEAFEAVFAFRQKRYITRERYSVTANLMMRREVFAAIGPFKGLEVSEDQEFGQRGAARGHPTRFAPAMRAYHPARRDFAEMEAKWRRVSAQLFGLHLAAGRSRWRWRLRAAVVAASPLVHGAVMLLSPRIAGLGNRLRGLAVLWRIRLARGRHMWGLAGAARDGPWVDALGWNA